MNEFSFEQYKKVASEFQLGKLTTESTHPSTIQLADDSLNDLSKAISSLKSVDVDALTILREKVSEVLALHEACQRVRQNGGRIYLCGCGATGRLSLAIEVLARMSGQKDIIGFMAGGDYALIKSVESFEDRMSYGSKQLEELGFKENDLLLAITEGGETSFVIGAVHEAAKVSQEPPFFLYCNPDEELLQIERSRKVIEDRNIRKLNLTIGPMALSGSTRMQATTIQMLVAGASILHNAPSTFTTHFYKLIDELIELDYELLTPFIELESKVYQEAGFITYESDEDFAISILTDTTERSPTFSLKPFETEDKEHSLCYLTIKNAHNSKQAWKSLLKRDPRALNWGILEGKVELNEIYKFDISKKSIERRLKLHNHHVFSILKEKDTIKFSLKNCQRVIDINNRSLLSQHLYLKLLLNTMSTLIMGRIGRYQSNVMTWVKPSNYKLIDRATRYVDHILKIENINKSYDEIARLVIELSGQIEKDEAIVLKVAEALK